MRGKGFFCRYSIIFTRITPAYAGKRHTDPDAIFRHQDHPRLCGEKILQRCFLMFVQGSPPPMRGKVGEAYALQWKDRITPAYAGKRNWSHVKADGVKGSPPPMRGKVIIIICQDDFIRITPAYAGKSGETVSDFIRLWDHPRLCGEKPHSDIIVLGSSGSPPPMRGKGNLLSAICDGLEDHPRLCGEKFLFVCRGTSTKGSPPPMRGKVQKSRHISW